MDIPSSCYPNIYTLNDDDDTNHIVNLSSSVDRSSSPSTGSLMDSSSPSSLLYNVSLLKDKVHHLHSLTTNLISQQNHQSTAANNVHGMANLLQEIIIVASSMMFTCQNMNISLCPGNISSRSNNNNNNNPSDTNILEHHNHHMNKLGSFDGALSSDHQQPNYNSESTTFDWCGTENFGLACNTSNQDDHNITTPPRVHIYHDHGTKAGNNGIRTSTTCIAKPGGAGADVDRGSVIKDDYDIIEMEAADLLAKYTHYCHVCGKGFKRDANLRMHMRAHGDEYKSTAALSNPMKSDPNSARAEMAARKYSCPQEGCRWNRKHAKFQPLKSMICVKNHYKRSHCPKMYVCKRCNRKQFSVLSDLRTHEKHCGDLKWQCSCGTTFSRKDKLMGHVALFIGHTPAVHTSSSWMNISGTSTAPSSSNGIRNNVVDQCVVKIGLDDKRR